MTPRPPGAPNAGATTSAPVEPGPSTLARRAGRVLAVGVACHAVAVATHGGEFWPFSTYSMFASAGRPWERALVRVMGDELQPTAVSLASVSLAALPGTPLLLGEHGISQNDLSSLVQKAERWRSAELDALAAMFGSLPCDAPLLVLRVRGSLEGAALEQQATPVAGLSCDSGQPRVRSLLGEPP